MFAFAFGDDMANLSTPPSGHTSCHERGVGDYMEGTDLWEQTRRIFLRGRPGSGPRVRLSTELQRQVGAGWPMYQERICKL